MPLKTWERRYVFVRSVVAGLATFWTGCRCRWQPNPKEMRQW